MGAAGRSLHVDDGSGAPIAGKTCTVHEVGGGALDVSPFVVTVASCGPSNDDGEIAVEGVRVSGGSSRPLSLRGPSSVPHSSGARATASFRAPSWRPRGALSRLSRPFQLARPKRPREIQPGLAQVGIPEFLMNPI